MTVGGTDGRVEFWDGEQKAKVHELFPNEGAHEITSVAFEPRNALQVAIGTEKGKVFLYDMRYPVPIYSLTHHYRMPIQQIKFHSSGKLISCDRKIIKIFNQLDGSLFTNIEPSV